MKTNFINRPGISALAILCMVLLFSCQKENSNENAAPVTEEEARVYADESAQAEASFDDVEDISMIAAEEEGVASETGRSGESGRYLPLFEELRLRLGPCATITVTPNDGSYPKTMTIDFGDGCICADGKFRKGAIILLLTNPIRRPGSVMTITFRNFFLNRAHLEGTKIVSNLSEGGNIKFTVQVVGGRVTFPSGRGYQYNGIRYVRQTQGGMTRIVRDDVYSIEGRSKMEFNGGLTINLNTETPLIKRVICPWINDGSLKIKINDHVLFLNFGAPANGECDNKGMLTWNNGNNQLLITLP